MAKTLKWIGISLVGLAIVISAAIFYLKSKFENLAGRIYTPKVEAITIPGDSASIERGKVLSVECRTCHGHDLAGSDFFNDPMIGYMSSPNLTRALGSATEKYSDLDYVRTLRHALNPTGRTLMVMPSENIGQMSDQDLGCLIAYLKTVDPIEKKQGPTNFTFTAKVMAGAGMFGNLYPYDVIDHDAVHHISAPNISSDPAYGEYFSKFIGCKSCHGAQLNGGISPDPVSPPAPNITAGGNLGKWTATQFIETVRNGKTPEGKVLKAEFMPWPGIGAHSEVELEGLYNYLKSLPALPTDPGVQKKMDKLASSTQE